MATVSSFNLNASTHPSNSRIFQIAQYPRPVASPKDARDINRVSASQIVTR